MKARFVSGRVLVSLFVMLVLVVVRVRVVFKLILSDRFVRCRCLSMVRPLGMVRNRPMSVVTPGLTFLYLVTLLLSVKTSPLTDRNCLVTILFMSPFMRWTFRVNSM